MKVRDLIEKLLRCPLDDEAKILVEIGHEQFSAPVLDAFRRNADNDPHTAIGTSISIVPKVTWEAE